jgi:hypothetical protein
MGKTYIADMLSNLKGDNCPYLIVQFLVSTEYDSTMDRKAQFGFVYINDGKVNQFYKKTVGYV